MENNTKPTNETSNEEHSSLHTLNIAELKKSDIDKKEENIWYLRLRYWILFGAAGSIIFVLLGLVNWRFLILIPLGPILGYISWYIRRLLRKFNLNDDLIN